MKIRRNICGIKSFIHVFRLKRGQAKEIVHGIISIVRSWPVYAKKAKVSAS